MILLVLGFWCLCIGEVGNEVLVVLGKGFGCLRLG